MSRITPPEIANRMSDEHRLDLLAQSGQPLSRDINAQKSHKAISLTRRQLLATLVLVTGLAVAWPREQPAGAVAPGRAIAAHENAEPMTNPPEGHTGIAPPASSTPVVKFCLARKRTAAKWRNTSFKGTMPVANPAEGHTGIVVPPPSDQATVAGLSSLCEQRRR